MEGCADIEENDISAWIKSDSDIGHQLLSKDEIVEACMGNTAIENDSSEEPVDSTHGEVTSMLKKLMVYFKKQSDMSSAELLTLRHLQFRMAKQRVFFKA